MAITERRSGSKTISAISQGVNNPVLRYLIVISPCCKGNLLEDEHVSLVVSLLVSEEFVQV
jgi:hypothetical protein